MNQTQLALGGDEGSGAVISPDKLYRYRLWRRWGAGRPVLFVMLNPSTADSNLNDPTIRRCIGFAMSWGFAALEVVNLFALRSPDPNHLKAFGKPGPHVWGPDNDTHIKEAAEKAAIVVAAWGCNPMVDLRVRHVLDLLQPRGVMCIAKTKKGYPKHPLYLKKDLAPMPYLGGVRR